MGEKKRNVLTVTSSACQPFRPRSGKDGDPLYVVAFQEFEMTLPSKMTFKSFYLEVNLLRTLLYRNHESPFFKRMISEVPDL